MIPQPKKSISVFVALTLSVVCIKAAPAADSEEIASGGTQRIELAIQNRSLGIEDSTLRVTEGNTIELVWTTDEAVELHLHGYDIELTVSATEPAIMAFEAHATGRFPITSHGFGGDDHGHLTLLYLEVHPR